MIKIKVTKSEFSRMDNQEFTLVKMNSGLWECINTQVQLKDPLEELDMIQQKNIKGLLNVELYEQLEHGCVNIHEIEILDHSIKELNKIPHGAE